MCNISDASTLKILETKNFPQKIKFMNLLLVWVVYMQKRENKKKKTQTKLKFVAKLLKSTLGSFNNKQGTKKEPIE